MKADTFETGKIYWPRLNKRLASGPCACIFIDEARFFKPRSGLALARYGGGMIWVVPIMCYGLPRGFPRTPALPPLLFPGSCGPLLALADEMREVPHNLPLR